MKTKPGNWFRCLGTGTAFLLGAGLFRHLYLVTLVVGNSMQPTLHDGDFLLISKRAYQSCSPQRGEMIVSQYHGELIVKRVLGLAGEEVELRNGQLLINGARLHESYPHVGRTNVRAGVLGQERFAILGDNRTSTIAAVIHKDQIVGKVIGTLRFWPRLVISSLR